MPLHRVVIVGGGFAGLYAAKSLGKAPVEVILVDRRNFHLFQPLLYQVATGALAPGEIAQPLRSVLKRQSNVSVLLGEATDVDLVEKRVILSDGAWVEYDTLVVATGARHAYFGHDEWEPLAPGLKTVEDAFEIRRRILIAFEAAEREADPDKRAEWMTFVVVGGGPTGVELAGALGEIANDTLKNDFRVINPPDARIVLVEALDRVLPPYPRGLSDKAKRSLEQLGVTVRTGALVTAIDERSVTVKVDEHEERIPARTVLWAAGVRGSTFGRTVAAAAGVDTDRVGRVPVEPELTVPGHPEIFVIGDISTLKQRDSSPVPGVAPAAIQEGQYVADAIRRRLRGQPVEPFRYRDKGSLATIGRGHGVADLGRFRRFSGFIAWGLWLGVHVLYLIGFQNRLLVLIRWAWSFFTHGRGSRLITGKPLLPTVDTPESKG